MLRRSTRTCKTKVTIEDNSNEPPIKRKCDPGSAVSVHDSLLEDGSSGDEFVPTPTTEIKEPCSLNLSESDSDTDQDCNERKVKSLQQPDTESDDDDKICKTNFDFTTLLNPKDTLKFPESNVNSNTLDTVEKNGIFDNVDVAKILSVGEGVNLKTVLKEEEKAKLKRDDNYTIPDMVEVTVKLPNDMRCKKGQDMQNVLRRRMNTICKDTQVLIHKVNLLLWISYGNHLNSVLNSPEVMGSALSLIPSEKSYPPKQCDLNYLENYMKWFSKKIKISSKTDPLCEINTLSLVENFSKRVAKTRYELIAMFISMLRSLGLNVRLMININAVSIKPNSEQLLGPLTDEDHMKPSSSKSQVEIKQKTPAKSEYFNKKLNKLEKSNKELDTKKSKVGGGNKKFKNKKSTVSEKVNEILITSSDEDDVFVKNAKSEYFNKKSNKGKTDFKKTDSKNSEFIDHKKSKMKKSKVIEKIDRRVLSSDEDDHTLIENTETVTKKRVKNDFWAEVFLEMEEKWFCVDVIGQRLHCIKEIYVSCILLIYLLLFNI